MDTKDPERLTPPKDGGDRLAMLDDSPDGELDLRDGPYCVVVPNDVWRDCVVVSDDVWPPQAGSDDTVPELRAPEDDEYDQDVVDAEEEDPHGELPRAVTGRARVAGLGGLATAVAAGAIPALFVDSPAALVAGGAAGLFGGLMGHSLCAEIYDRTHRDDEEDE